MTPAQLLLAAFLLACLAAPALSQTAAPPPQTGPTEAAATVPRSPPPRPLAITSGSGRTEIVGSRSSFKALRGRPL